MRKENVTTAMVKNKMTSRKLNLNSDYSGSLILDLYSNNLKQNIKQILAVLPKAKRWNKLPMHCGVVTVHFFVLLNNIPVRDHASIYPLAHWGHVSCFSRLGNYK